MIAPGRKKRFGVAVQSKWHAAFAGGGAEAVITIDLADSIDRGELQPGLSGINKELQRPGTNDRVFGNLLRRLQIALQARIVEELHCADVGEAFAAGCVADEFAI